TPGRDFLCVLFSAGWRLWRGICPRILNRLRQTPDGVSCTGSGNGNANDKQSATGRLAFLGLFFQLLLGILAPVRRSFLQATSGLLVAGNPCDRVVDEVRQVGCFDCLRTTGSDRSQLTCSGGQVIVLNFVLEVVRGIADFMCGFRNFLGRSVNDWSGAIGGILPNVFCPVPNVLCSIRDCVCQRWCFGLGASEHMYLQSRE